MQAAARCRLQRLRDVVGVIELFENLEAAVVIGLADFGQADLPRGAVEKARAEPLFESMDVSRRGAWRYPEPAACRCEPARLHHLDEGGHACHPIQRHLLPLVTRWPAKLR